MEPFIYNTKPRPKKLILLLNIAFIFLIFLFLKAYLHPSHSNVHASTKAFNHARMLSDISVDGCSDLHKYSDYDSKCLYVKSHVQCRSKGYINYLQIFYCSFGHSPILGHALLVLWLVVLFYLLADTASNYFCANLEGLSDILRLSPTIAGVTLLSLGNGAPDFFASVVSFTRSNDGAVGLNSILGGAFFVSSAVLGIISFLVGSNEIAIDKASFIRDVIFFLFSLFILLVIISIGKITLLGSIFYVSIYFLYVCAVSATHFIYGGDRVEAEIASSSDDLAESGIPLLGCVDDEKEKPNKEVIEEKQEGFGIGNDSFDFTYLSKFVKVLELPLCLPRRLTIPVVSEESWSKPYAVISVTLAPVLFAALCNTQMENSSSRSGLVAYLTAALVGIVLGNMAWVSPSILGLTVLAWGNSLGDLIANGAMAKNGGADGAQIAVSGCYAGPMFNILMGLGLPLVLSAWSEYPEAYVIPKDPSLYATLLFLMGGVLWALVILAKKNMKLDKSLGAGLLTIYLCFLFIRLAMAIGVIKF
uniref:Cation/calcium exchanger 4 n=1 Tax=Cajanus cajan TaxID=3821 RepID=A0A151RK52_CAJCA|nr:Cation/calcium exchanger 4 [Cajanus cajan]